MPISANGQGRRKLTFQAPQEHKTVAEFLRGKNGPKIRRGILNGKRVDYFKGTTAVRVLNGPAYQKTKKVPEVKDEAAAAELLGKIIPSAFFLRVDRAQLDPPPPSGTPKTLLLAPQQHFTPDAYYAWFYDGSPLYTYLGAAAMVLVIFAGVLFPLWPVTLRLGVWYLSILALGAIGALIVLAIVRLIFWCCTVVCAKKAIWIFPNLFEDVGFVDSFIPLWAFDEPKKKKKKSAGDKTASSSTSAGKPKKSSKAGTTGPIPIAGDISGQTIAKPELQQVVGEAAGAGSAAGASGSGSAPNGSGASEAKSTGVQNSAGAGIRHRQATVEEVEDDE